MEASPAETFHSAGSLLSVQQDLAAHAGDLAWDAVLSSMEKTDAPAPQK
jgi:hypothetical protein